MHPVVKVQFSSLSEVLQYRASDASGSAENIAFTYLNDGEQVSGTLTYRELDRQARQLAAQVQRHTRQGDRVLLVFPPSMEYIVAFFACAYAGVIAVPALPPANARTLPRLRLIAEDARAQVALTLAAISERSGTNKIDTDPVLSQMTWIATDTLPAIQSEVPEWNCPEVHPSDIVFLQYTSGSTGTPKGVAVSNANILANLALINASFALKTTDVIVSWLPPHHDMGLIGKILFPVYVGCQCVQFPPAAFLTRPYRWLKAISHYKARITAAPNFAYELCINKISDEQKQTLDLSTLEFALNGAEPIRLSTLQRFTQAFTPCGFQAGAITPVYGLAESTLLVSANTSANPSANPDQTPTTLPTHLAASKAALVYDTVQPSTQRDDTIDLVSTGVAGEGEHHVIIVDPSTQTERANDTVGEIWVAGPSVAQQYWNRPEESQRTFAGRLAEREQSYLRTGDLGFIHERQLYITGRMKDMMIFNGRNIYPQDIEATVEQLDPAFSTNGCAAFSLDDESTTQLVIIQEIQSRTPSRTKPVTEGLPARLRAELAEQHGILDIAAIVLVKAGHIPRTSSGKIQHARCKALYQAKELVPLWEWKSANSESSAVTEARQSNQADCAWSSETQRKLAAIWKELLDVETINISDDFFQLGGHSLLATQLISQIRTVFQKELPLRAIFDAPTIEALAREIEQFQQEQPGLIAPAILPVARHETLPLSFAQQRLWFLDQFESGSAFYNMPAAVRLAGQLDVAALRCTLNEIVRRHEALRTSFKTTDGQPQQAITPVLELTLPVTDLSALPPGEREARMQWLAQDEAQTPFDLSTGPLIRAGLIKLDDTHHIITLTLHHIVSDGWSMGVLVQEIATLYSAYAQNQASPLPELTIQYADYAHWQRHWLSGAVLDAQTGYWKAQLSGAPTLLALPTDRPRPAVQTYRGASHAFTIAAAATAKITALSKQTQSTLFMTLTAAFNILLSRYTGQEDICIGTPIANRQRAEVEPLIGFFVNTLVLRNQVDGQQTFTDLLQQVRHNALGAYAHQDVPFEQLVEALKPERHTSHAPLFQVMIVLQNALMGELTLPGLTLQPIAAANTSAKFDLTLNLTETGNQVHASFEYNTDLFDQSTIERMAGHYTRLLDAIALDPGSRIGELPMLSESERTQILDGWNATRTAYPQDSTIHQLFEDQVQANPQATAVVFERQELTYGELNARANQLAHHLRNLGVGPDVLVGICVERSLEMIVGLLGILKAGGAYVPLDPAYPKDRLAYMLADAKPAVLLTQSRLLESLPVHGTPRFCLDAGEAVLAGYSTDNPEHTAQPGNLAYVIYTSGSTGKPKGILVHQGGFGNLLDWFIAQFKIGRMDRVILFSSFSFDLTQKNIFSVLAVGGQLHVPSEGYAPEKAFSYIREHGITTLNCAPSAFYPLLEYHSEDQPLSIQQIFLGGEPIQGPILRQAFLKFDDVPVFHNTYGPTEASDVVSFFTCDIMDASETLAIGRPIANTQIYLLDCNLNPVPVGVPGELHIAGAGLARGYLNRAELTADKFIPNPFGVAGSRMYKSGDLARYLPDGNIEYLGRIDTQVKIRGFRIELGEIEAALTAQPGIREAVVLAREDAAGDKRLVAYVVMQEGRNEKEAEASMRSALLQSLPDYMVPAHYIKLEKLPLTPNGKIDRKALPAPDMARSEEGYVAPGTPTEEILAGIWAEVLKLDKVGIHDNFFALGGHSLLATQVISKLRTALHIELPLRSLFETPTVAAFCTRIARAQQEQQDQPGLIVPPMPPVSRHEVLPLSFAQQRLWFLDQFESDKANYNIAGAVRLAGQLDVAALRRTLNEIVRRHEALRTSFKTTDGQPQQAITPVLELTLPVTDLSALPPGEREARMQWLAQDEAQTPFDLSTGPLIRAGLIKLDDTHHIITLTLHHIVSDGWSMGVLVQEIATLYSAYAQNQASPLPELTIQYADYAHWQRHWLSGAVLDAQTGYWKAQLSGAPTLLALPTDRPRPAVQTYRGASHAFTIAAAATAKITALSKQTQSTLFMTLTAAFNILLSRYTGQEDICIGTPIANRQRAEVEPLIGCFVNTLVLRNQVERGYTFTDLLQQVRHTALGAYAHQDVPFEQLVDVLKPERHTSHAPLFQVMIVLQNAPMGELTLPGLTLQPIHTDTTTAKFDLTLNLTEAGNLLHAELEYSTDLFDSSTIERMAGHYTRLLDAIAMNPGCRIGELPMLSTTERTQILDGWNATRTAYPQDSTIHQLFEEQAQANPQATAVVFERQELTYGELNARANQLAHHLRASGVGPDVLVGICVERSIEMIVGLLGILKAGGAYVPLDPVYPKDRLAYMLADAKPAVLLTQSRLLESLPVHGIPSICLDAGQTALAGYPDSNLKNTAQPDNLAYVIYTSGSTGAPKGVTVQHQSVINLIKGWQIRFGDIFNASPVISSLWTNFGFDVSLFEIFVPLSLGGAIHIAPELIRSNPQALLSWLTQQDINFGYLPPFLISQLMDVPDQLITQVNLKLVLVGVEPLKEAELYRLKTLVPDLEIVNGYGPTEATVFCSSYTEIGNLLRTAPIGRPIANTQIYLLDCNLHPVPVGVPGELHIAGAGLARGYLNRPELTADKFIPNPFSQTPGTRMYKSGDLARYLPDGNIEYLGRIDTQVKIRGFRIELGEIEAALTAQPGIREAVVLAREDGTSEKRLVAYVVAQAGSNDHEKAAEASTLRAALLHSLPDYMVPAHYVTLEKLPLTPNGKIDRKALPAPDMVRSEEGYVAPRTPKEEILAGIWADVLKLDKIGIHDNFFEIGGNSMQAIKLHADMIAHFPDSLVVVDLYRYPTVEKLATYLDKGASYDSLISASAKRGANRRARNMSSARRAA